MLCRLLPLLVFLALLWPLVGRSQDRVSEGLLAQYDFSAGEGNTIIDRGGAGNPLNLVIEKSSRFAWSDGGLHIQGPAVIASAEPARKIIDAVKKSGEISLEVWCRPENQKQAGPARIVSISHDTSNRNFTLGQEANLYDVRLRTTGTSTNGLPSTSSPDGSLSANLTHVVFTRDAGGETRIYLDGKQAASGKVAGSLSNWDEDYRLLLANEATKDRPWLGTLSLVAVYDRAISPEEVKKNFAAGSRAEPPKPSAESIALRHAEEFNSRVAPLFAKHCLECHDTAIKKGDLDLSKKTSALAGGENGKAIVPGKLRESLLWEAVESGEMPKDRPPLSGEEKEILKSWLTAGAVWPVEEIDPAVYINEGQAGEVWVQRLTVPEYIETVRSAAGVDIAKEARELLPPDLRADGFNNTSYNLNIDLKHVEAYHKLAEIIADKMDVLKFAARFSKSRELSTDATMRDHAAGMGKWLLRGPLDNREIDLYSGIATTVASAGGDFEEANRYMIEAMLQSPRFIYRMENQGQRSRPAAGFELASRLSYILWGAPPDEELFRAAEKGELADRKKIEAQLDRMLKDPRAITRSEEFILQWLNLGRLANLQPNKERFPQWNANLAEDMRRETVDFFKEIAWTQNRPLAELLSAQVTFASPRLAEHYGLQPAGEKTARYDLSQVPERGGLLTQASVLTIGGDEASMVSRGLFVLRDLLRGVINAPPPCVDTVPPPTKAGLTQRAIAEARIASQKCGVCHGRFEPLAFGLEKYDGIGGFHENDEHGNPLRDDGEILFPGSAQPVAYKTSFELMELLAKSERVQLSLTWKVTQFALGRPLVAADAPVVAEIHASSQSAGGTYKNILKAIVLSDLVLKTRPASTK